MELTYDSFYSLSVNAWNSQAFNGLNDGVEVGLPLVGELQLRRVRLQFQQLRVVFRLNQALFITSFTDTFLLFKGAQVWAAKFLMRMLSLTFSSAVLSKHAEHTHQELMRTLSMRVRN
jgi:hypothetical protein